MTSPATDDVVEHFNFQELPGADEVAGNPDVRLRGGWLAAGMVVLCAVPIYVTLSLPPLKWNGYKTDGLEWDLLSLDFLQRIH